MVKAANLEGQVFDRLTVTRRGGNNQRGQARWLCSCECGGEALATTTDLRSGNTRSCGCLQAEGRDRRTHGESGTRLYKIWAGIKKRCCSPKSTVWLHYGGRGISVCADWQSYESFRDWALSSGYADDLTIERIDADGHYAPDNCEWITQSEQSRRANVQRRGHMVMYGGRETYLKDACRMAGLPYKTVHARITRGGWDVDRALSTPVGG